MAECKYCGYWAGIGSSRHEDCAKGAAAGKTNEELRVMRTSDGTISDARPTHICGNCRSRIRPLLRREGSTAVEVLLWLFLLVPGVIYSIWRSSTRKPVCPICAAPHPIPLGTPAADALNSIN